MMTNPECALIDHGEIKFRGTLEGVLAYLDGYADAVIDAVSDALDYHDFSDVPDEVVLGPVWSADIDADDWDSEAAYADVLHPYHWAYSD